MWPSLANHMPILLEVYTMHTFMGVYTWNILSSTLSGLYTYVYKSSQVLINYYVSQI